MSSPMPWRRFGTVKLPAGVLLGEDVLDEKLAGFSGDRVVITCRICQAELGKIPVELCDEEMADITNANIGSVLDWHYQKEHGVERCPQQF